MDTGHFFGPGSDSTHKRPTRDPTRLHANAMRYITNYISTIKTALCEVLNMST